MKRFYKIAVSCFISGLILIGIGGAVTVYDVSTFTDKGDKYDVGQKAVVYRNEIELPNNNSKIVYFDDYNFKIVSDDSVAENKAVVETSCNNMRYAETVVEINENYYLKNLDTYNYSKYPVNYLHHYYSNSTSNKTGTTVLKDILNDLKNKEIYNYNAFSYDDIESTLRVSPRDYERFTKIYSYKYDILNEDEYNIAIMDTTSEYTYEEEY